jgi:hypothetical protein
LSPEQISSVVAGSGTDEEFHVSQCAFCAAEVERARNILLLFRSSVRSWSEAQSDAVAFDIPSSRASRQSPLAWVLAAAAVAAMVAVPVYRNSREREIQAQAERDAQLIDDVNAQLSRRAPVAMQPLMRLMSVKNTAGDADRHGVK